MLSSASENVFVPLTVGGGIRDFTDSEGHHYSALEVAAAYFRCRCCTSRASADLRMDWSGPACGERRSHMRDWVVSKVMTAFLRQLQYAAQARVMQMNTHDLSVRWRLQADIKRALRALSA